MSTVLYDSPVFGPVRSRRLGLSLGVNLCPADGKICTFDCIYCECGLNADRRPRSPRPTREEVAAALRDKLQQMTAEGNPPDVITFAGNGEPTAHPKFLEIIDDTIALRDRLCPDAKVSVLTNGTLIERPNVFRALRKVDNNIVKLDTVNLRFIQQVDRPLLWYDLEQQILLMERFKRRVYIQTMFLKGTVNGKPINNTTPDYVIPWLAALKQINPMGVMIYTIDRDTPLPTLEKALHEELDDIARQVRKLNLPCSVSY